MKKGGVIGIMIVAILAVILTYFLLNQDNDEVIIKDNQLIVIKQINDYLRLKFLVSGKKLFRFLEFLRC